MSFISIFLGLLGLSFIVFIHELGHYIMARRVGMRVEVFSIGIGKALVSWKFRGVTWQIGMLPFGGFVKVAGMDTENGVDPYQIKDGYFGRGPWARVKVAFMGPLVNIVFAFLLFAAIWGLGGRSKSFESNTKIIGWIDPTSELATKGVRPGDTISSYNGQPFHGFKDLLRQGLVKADKYSIAGEKIDYATGEKSAYQFNLETYPDARFGKEIKTIGVLNPASYLIFGGFLPTEGAFSPMQKSGIEEGDRILWANGETIFSAAQLNYIVNLKRALLTIKRGDKIHQVRVPRVEIGELELSALQKGEFLDWKRELAIEGNLDDLAFIPYEVNDRGEVVRELSFIDSDLFEEAQKNAYFARGIDMKLEQGDQILAVYGKPLAGGIDLLKRLKKQKVVMMTRPVSPDTLTWKTQDAEFERQLESLHLAKAAELIGVDNEMLGKEGLRLLKPVIPITAESFYKSVGGIKALQFANQMKAVKDPSIEQTKYLFLGAKLRDEMVTYNPSPFIEMKNLVEETWKTFSSLVTGSLSPKWLSGPVGMVHVMQEGWKIGFKEALYWMALISLNLGIINLFPIPVLDGGHICFAMWEVITRRPLKVKTMERMVIPFVVVLIMVFIYTTYHDVSRLFFH